MVIVLVTPRGVLSVRISPPWAYPQKDLIVGVFFMIVSIFTGIALWVIRSGIESLTFGQRIAILIGLLISVVMLGWTARQSVGRVYKGNVPV